MFLRDPSSSLPHPHFEAPEPDAEQRLLSITRAIADIGRRNDEMRQRIAERWQLVDHLFAEGDRRDT